MRRAAAKAVARTEAVVQLEVICEANAMAHKATRLTALQDTPTAFCSTYARESVRTDEEWVERARKSDGMEFTGFLANDHGVYCGVAWGVVDDADHRRAYLVSMWVAPSHRRSRVGWLLVDAVWNWACARGFRELALEVTDTNAPAIAFYEKFGFAMTGRTRPHDHQPGLMELEMIRSINPAS